MKEDKKLLKAAEKLIAAFSCATFAEQIGSPWKQTKRRIAALDALYDAILAAKGVTNESP